MEHLPKLIEDLALILLVGAIVTLLFKKIKQPVVLGYIIAGFCVGPHLSLIPTVADTQNISILAEIGIIFLLFSLGLEFNLKKLIHIGGPSSVTATIEIVFITITGYFTGLLMNWSVMDSIFLGGMLASSSTTIIIKAFDDLGIRAKPFASIVFGVLIVEDIVVILLLVLLPTIALAQQFQGVDLILTILKLFGFLIIMFVAGIYILPTFFKKAKSLLNEESLLIVAIGLCLGMAVLSSKVGFSVELGAFLIGFILAESTSAEKIENVIKPVKDLFAAVFFVSIGMMIEPQSILKHGWAVLIVSALTIFGKLISTVCGALLSGQPLRQSVQVGMSMAQIGEFAFIVATLGLSLGVISDFLFPVAVGASAITTFTTPYMIKYSDKLSLFLESIIPQKWQTALSNYSLGTQTIQTDKIWKKVFRSYLIVVITNTVLVLTMIFLAIEFLLPFTREFIQNETISKLVGLIITLGIISPFLWGLMAKRLQNIAYKSLWANKEYNRGPLLVIEIFRMIWGIALVGFLVDKIFSTQAAIFVLVPMIFIFFIFFSKSIRKFYQRLERRFLHNLNSEPNP